MHVLHEIPKAINISLCVDVRIFHDCVMNMETHRATKHTLNGDSANIDVKLDDEDKPLHLLNFLPNSYKNFKSALLYGKKDAIILEEVQSAIKTKELTKLKDKAEDSGEDSNASREESEGK
ncbi:cytochrome p450 [Trifolium pratense]|uniref:Cytochrome p450 n=1 Tax=Trifolium pratense TaxID=57577 RepID=A0A2K3LYH4_TRIPR|nr:cytochrome p450 [Trifolium pratense]